MPLASGVHPAGKVSEKVIRILIPRGRPLGRGKSAIYFERCLLWSSVKSERQGQKRKKGKAHQIAD